MPAPIAGLHDTPVGGYGFMVPAFSPDAGATFSALDLDCPDCRAPVGELCAGPRICVGRLNLARKLIAEEELQARGTAAEGAVPDELRSPIAMPARWNTNTSALSRSGPRSKLTDGQRREIIRRYRTERISKSELGRQYGVSDSTIAIVISKG